MCFTGEDSGGRLTKSTASGRKTSNGLVVQSLVACNFMSIREMLPVMRVIISVLFRLRTMQVSSRTHTKVALPQQVLSLLLLVSSTDT